MIATLLGAFIGLIIGTLLNIYVVFPLLDWLTGNKE